MASKSKLFAELLDANGDVELNALDNVSATLGTASTADSTDFISSTVDDTAAGVIDFNPTSGSVPFTVNSGKTSVVTNLNADRLDGIEGSKFDQLTSFVATGNITSGDIVSLRSDGTVEIVSDSISVNSYSSMIDVLDTETTPDNIVCLMENDSFLYDSVTDRFVTTFYALNLTNFGYTYYYAVGEQSGNTINYTLTAESFLSGSAHIVMDTINNKVVSFHRESSTSDSRGRVGTINPSTNVITWGAASPSTGLANNISYSSFLFDPYAQRVIFFYKDQNNSGYGTSIVGEVNGANNTISFNTPTVFHSAITGQQYPEFCSTINKNVIFFSTPGQTTGYDLVALPFTTNSQDITGGNLLTVASSQDFGTNNTSIYMDLTFDSNADRIIALFKDTNNSDYFSYNILTYSIGGSPSQDSLSAGGINAINNVVYRQAKSGFNLHTNNLYFILTVNTTGLLYFWNGTVNTSNNTIDFIESSPEQIDDVSANYTNYTNSDLSKPAFNSASNTISLLMMNFHTGQSGSLGSYLITPGGEISTNADSWIGIAAEDIVSASFGNVYLNGNVASNLSSLTIGSEYYVNYDGTLTTTESGSVTGTYGKIGKALATNKLLLTTTNNKSLQKSVALSIIFGGN